MRKNIFLLPFLSAFDNTSAGWKLDADGKIVMKDGNPVYLKSDGSELVVANDTIGRLNSEAKLHREAKEAAETALAKFKDLDPDVARKAIETVSKLDAKKLIDSGEVDKLTDQIKSQFAAQISEKDNALTTLQSKINDMLISDVFKTSDFVRDGIAVPRDMFESSFRNNFKIEDGKIVVYDKAGNRLLSKSRAGEYAEPDEALRLLVEAHPQKDVILKADVGNGSGNNGGGGNKPGGRVMKRMDFEKLSPLDKAATAQKVGSGEMKLVD